MRQCLQDGSTASWHFFMIPFKVWKKCFFLNDALDPCFWHCAWTTSFSQDREPRCCGSVTLPLDSCGSPVITKRSTFQQRCGSLLILCLPCIWTWKGENEWAYCWPAGVYIIYTMNSRNYPVTGVTIRNIHCLAWSKSGMVILSVKSQAFNLMICIQPVKTWPALKLLRISLPSLELLFTLWCNIFLWSWQPGPEVIIIMARWQRLSPLIASVLLSSHSAARLLLLAPLLAAIGSAARVHVRLSSAAPEAHWHG